MALNPILKTNKPIRVLLADDDKDDRFFFERNLRNIQINTAFVAVVDGEKLMNYLFDNSDNLPDVLFLDLNMPRKNGLECLLEIKKDITLHSLPVVIFSTSLNQHTADIMYNNGAYYYIRKTNNTELQNMLQKILSMIANRTFIKPLREEFHLGSSLV